MNKNDKYLQNLNEIQEHLGDPALASAFGTIQKALMKTTVSKTNSIASNIAINLYSDGACRGNPGPGSWACFARDMAGKTLFQKTGVETVTTNNRMEMQGVIQGLKGILDLKQAEQSLEFFTDSKYLVNGINDWMPGWKRRGWKKADKKAPENLELWQELDEILSHFPKIKFSWVKGHSGHPENDLCDQMANMALDDAGF